MWEFINKIAGRHKSNKPKNDIDFIKVDGKKIKNGLEIADVFNNFFTNIGSDLAKKIDSNNNTVNDRLNELHLPDFYH